MAVPPDKVPGPRRGGSLDMRVQEYLHRLLAPGPNQGHDRAAVENIMRAGRSVNITPVQEDADDRIWSDSRATVSLYSSGGIPSTTIWPPLQRSIPRTKSAQLIQHSTSEPSLASWESANANTHETLNQTDFAAYSAGYAVLKTSVPSHTLPPCQDQRARWDTLQRRGWRGVDTDGRTLGRLEAQWFKDGAPATS